jgi:hypothetical protein
MKTNEDGGVKVLAGLPISGSTITSNDPINPGYYKSGDIECIDAIESMLGLDGFIAFLRGQVVKYDWRLLDKDNATQDSKKASWYQDRLTKALQKKAQLSRLAK